MKVELIAVPRFIGEDTDEFQRTRDDQMVGADGERLAEFAGRGCYDSFGRGRNSDDFAANILEHNHVNVLYHAHYTMWITGISRNLSHELVRHHVGFSPSQRSTRYCDESGSKVMHHPDLMTELKTTPDNDEVLGAMHCLDEAWRELYVKTVDFMLKRGHDKKTAYGAAARYLPNGIETRITWTGNAAAFVSMIERRSVPKVVDAEFVQLAREMLKIMKVQMPRYFGHLGVAE